MIRRRLAGAGLQRRIGRFFTPSAAGGAPPAPLEDQILAALSDGTCIGLYLARADVVDDTEVGTWTDLSGEGNDLTQSTASAKPDLLGSAVGSADGVNFDGGDHIDASSCDFSGADAYAIIGAIQDSTATQTFWATLGTTGGNSFVTMRVNGTAGEIGVQAKNAVTTRADSNTSYPMTTAGVVAGTWDSSLGIDECEIRHDGVNVTNSRVANADNSTGALTDGPITLGALNGGGSSWTGAIGACVIVKFPSGLTLSEVEAVESLLSAALSAGSWA